MREQSEDEDCRSTEPNVATFYVFQNADKKNIMYNHNQGSLFGQRLGTISDFEQGKSYFSKWKLEMDKRVSKETEKRIQD